MARPRSTNPTDTTLRIRCHKDLIIRLQNVAERNHRSTGKQGIIALEEHIAREEKRLGLAPPQERTSLLSETTASIPKGPDAKTVQYYVESPKAGQAPPPPQHLYAFPKVQKDKPTSP